MKLHGKILGVSEKCFYTVVLACTIGILLGSFFDFQINERLANVTKLGSFFAAYGCYFSYCLYPAAGMCLYKGLKKKGFSMAGTVLLIIGWFLAVYYTNTYSGGKLRELLFHYKAGESSPWLSVLNWLIIAVLYVWPMLLGSKILDEKDADRLIAVGAAILIAGVVSDNVNQWLKQLASRPRYKYLITLDDPRSDGNMTIAAMMFSLPMLADVTKKRSEGRNFRCFIVACVFVLLYGYNRIHMTNHFLTDVCFGTLITYLIHAVVSKALLPTDRLTK